MIVIKECPNHGGNFDCHSFCRICEGFQEYEDGVAPTALTKEWSLV